MRVAPALNPAVPNQLPRPLHLLLINPFYPKDPHASFGKHVFGNYRVPHRNDPAPRRDLLPRGQFLTTSGRTGCGTF
jgi:hypothetical protein